MSGSFFRVKNATLHLFWDVFVESESLSFVQKTVMPMTIKYALSLILCCLPGFLLAQQIDLQTHRIYFDWDRDALKAEAIHELKQLELRPDCKVRIAAHCDERGSLRYNEDLAQRRAQSVVEYLTQNGNPEVQFEIQTFGEREPWRLGSTETDWKWNRRVDIHCDCRDENGEIGEGEEPGEFEEGPVYALEDLLKQLQPAQQYFQIRPDQDTVLQLAEGGELHFSAHSLDVKNAAPVEIQVEEYYDFAAMIGGHLMTKTVRGERLETGGMLQILAFQDGEPVNLKPGEDYVVRIPTTNYKPDMKVFYGTAHDDEVLWEGQGQALPGYVPVEVRERIYPRGWWRVMWYGMFNREMYKYNQSLNVTPLYRTYTVQRRADSYAASQMDSTGLAYYYLPVTRFGFINCDRWPRRTRRTNMTIAMEPNMSRQAYLVFKKERGIMKANSNNRNFIFTSIPADRECDLLVLEHLGEEFRYTYQTVSTNDIQVEPSNWETRDAEEFPEVLAGLGL